MEIKYEAVFGPQELFDGMMDDCEFVVGTYGYKIKDGKCFYCEKYNHKYGWAQTGDAAKALSPVIAMRRIIRTQHTDDIAVDNFAIKMKEKLATSRAKGRSGWESCRIEYLIAALKEHVAKGDPVDVANFAMMISLRGESIINTPVKYEQKSASIFDLDGHQVGAYIPDDQGAELAKRINLHGSLVEALKYSVDFMEDRAATQYDLNKVSEFRKLLEQCK